MKLILLVCLLAATASAQSRVYLVQDDPAPMQVLAGFLEKHGHPSAVEDQPAFRRHMASISPEAVFMYVHGTFDPEIERQLISYAERGGRLIVVHHGAASGKMRNQQWMPFLGLRITGTEPNKWLVVRGNFELVNLNPSHYVTSHRVEYPKTVAYTSSDAPSAEQHRPAIELPDTEAFLNQIFTDGRRKTVLFGYKIQVKGQVYMQDRGGWMMPAGKGYVFYFQPGHVARDFENANYAQVLLNAVEWRLEAAR